MIFPPLAVILLSFLADDVKMVFPRAQSSRLLPLSPSLSAADTDHQIPQVTDVRDLGVSLEATFTASAHCREAANKAR